MKSIDWKISETSRWPHCRLIFAPAVVYTIVYTKDLRQVGAQAVARNHCFRCCRFQPCGIFEQKFCAKGVTVMVHDCSDESVG